MPMMEQALGMERTKEDLKTEAVLRMFSDAREFFGMAERLNSGASGSINKGLISMRDDKTRELYLRIPKSNTDLLKIVLDEPAGRLDISSFGADPFEGSRATREFKLFTISAYHNEVLQHYDVIGNKGKALGYKKTLRFRHEIADRLFSEQGLENLIPNPALSTQNS